MIHVAIFCDFIKVTSFCHKIALNLFKRGICNKNCPQKSFTNKDIPFLHEIHNKQISLIAPSQSLFYLNSAAK